MFIVVNGQILIQPPDHTALQVGKVLLLLLCTICCCFVIADYHGKDLEFQILISAIPSQGKSGPEYISISFPPPFTFLFYPLRSFATELFYPIDSFQSAYLPRYLMRQQPICRYLMIKACHSNIPIFCFKVLTQVPSEIIAYMQVLNDKYIPFYYNYYLLQSLTQVPYEIVAYRQVPNIKYLPLGYFLIE